MELKQEERKLIELCSSSELYLLIRYYITRLVLDTDDGDVIELTKFLSSMTISVDTADEVCRDCLVFIVPPMHTHTYTHTPVHLQDGMTALMHATYRGNAAVCKKLIEHGADVNWNGHKEGVGV